MARWWLLVSTLGMVLGLGCGSDGGASSGDTEGTSPHGSDGVTWTGDGLDPWPRCANDDECSLRMQDCAEGMKCAPCDGIGMSMWNTTKCAPLVSDPRRLGESCTYVRGTKLDGVDDCEFGTVCRFYDEETRTGICTAQCLGQLYECPEGSDCHPADNPPAFETCLFPCDPLAPDCIWDLGCYPSRYDEYLPVAVHTCQPDSAQPDYPRVGYGEPCGVHPECEYGMFCSPQHEVPGGCDEDPRFGCCTPYCDVAAPNTCPGMDEGQECLPWYEAGAAPAGLEDLGYCGMP
jgi:hypothetical protein